MVLQTERCRCPCSSPQQQNWLTHQDLSYLSGNPQHHQSGWSTGSGYNGNGASQHHGRLNNGGRLGDSEYFGGLLIHGRPNNGGRLGDSNYHGGLLRHGNSFNHGHSSYGNGTNYGYQNSSRTTKNLDE
ncbi:hypothetical protein CTI12_AA075920 [Artemisia annua]|uniref:Uncharacterized protein n=1 Tax=Artemisia annua TaxID=35608 RepID=A0A2U1Q4V4_ARTAN|nr:hypothetical protein CTI12_AA075920 [Artemisia annua]